MPSRTSPSRRGRTIFVGDVHGCADELDTLLSKIRVTASDEVVFVGDLVARGPESGKAVAIAMRCGGVAVRGNHDQKIIAWWRAQQGLARTEHTLGERHRFAATQLKPEHFAWLDALPYMIPLAEHGVLVVHAGVDPSEQLEHQDQGILLNVRSIDRAGRPSRRLDGDPWARHWRGPPHIVFGHDARRGLQFETWATGLDSGCVYGRELSALVLDAGEPIPKTKAARRSRLVSVAARRAWCPIGDGNGAE